MDPLIVQSVRTIEGPDGSVKLDLQPISDSELPTVSILVPTRNRHNFRELILRNWESVDYPRDKLEMIVLDSGDSPIKEFSDSKIRYVRHDPAKNGKLKIGAARNILASLAKHKYLVHMDDDDWYPPLSVICRIRVLLDAKKRMGVDACVGCQKALCLDLITNQMFEAFDRARDGSPASISESSMAYSKDYWAKQGWNDSSTCGEFQDFIRDRHDTVISCNSEFIVVQFSHGANTVRRHIDPDTDTSVNTSVFLSSMTMHDDSVFNAVRAKCILEIPEYRTVREIIMKNYSIKALREIHSDLPESVKTNPFMIEYYRSRMVTKTKSSGRDIVYYCGPGTYFKADGKWNPAAFTGGSEEAVVNITSELAKRGYNVTVYCNLLGHKTKYGNVKYLDYYKWVPGDRQDVTVIWRDPSNCAAEINSKCVILDVHDFLKPEWLKEVPSHVKIFLKSKFHRKTLPVSKELSGADRTPRTPRTPRTVGIVRTVPNMVHTVPTVHTVPAVHTVHTPWCPGTQKTRRAMLCTSSPERCLVGLLKALPLIRAHVPDAEIHWAYGFATSRSAKYTAWADSMKSLVSSVPGFVALGHLSVEEINGIYQKYPLFVYPTRFPEIDCVSLTKAGLAGCKCIVTGSGAMPEKVKCIGSGLELYGADSFDFSVSSGPEFEQFVSECIRNLTEDETSEPLLNPESYEPGAVIKAWIDEF